MSADDCRTCLETDFLRKLTGIDAYVPLGVVMASMMEMLTLGIIVMMQIRLYFNLEISVGCTRREFCTTFYVVSLIGAFVVAGVLILLCAAENAMCRALYPGIRMGIDFLPYLLKWSVPFNIAIVVLAGFVGTLAMRLRY